MYKVAVLCTQGNVLVQVTQAVESGHLCVSLAPLLPRACYRTSRLSLSFLGCEVRLLINLYLSVWLSINEEMCIKHITWCIVSFPCIVAQGYMARALGGL